MAAWRMRNRVVRIYSAPASRARKVISAATIEARNHGVRVLSAYMIRLNPEDFDKPEAVAALAKAGKPDPAEFVRRFGPLAGRA